MTREEMALVLDDAIDLADSAIYYPGDEELAENLTLVASELRKVCGTCQHWRDPHDKARNVISPSPFCSLNGGISPLPHDGSGFCHRWESQPIGKAQD